MEVSLQYPLSTTGSVKAHDKSVIGEPYITQNGGLYPQLPTCEPKDLNNSGTCSRNSDNNNDVDSGMSSGSESSSDSKDSTDSSVPLLDNGHTQKRPTDETGNSCRMDPSVKRPLIQSGGLPVSPEEADRHVSVDISGPPTPSKVSIQDKPENGAGDLSTHTSEEDGPYHCRKPSLTKDSSWKIIAIIFSILDILLFITILVISCGGPARGPASVADGSNCLECKHVYLTEDDRHDNIYNFQMKDNGNVCCSKNQTLLLQKYVLKRYKHDHAMASAARYNATPKRTAVHVDLDIQDKNSVSEGVNQVLKWSTKDALMNGHLTLTPTGTHVKCARAGLYYINSKVVFQDTKASAATKHPVLLLQVYRVREGQKLLLLENKSSQCGDAVRDCNVPSSAQGVFQLQEGDQVFVSVTKQCGLVLQPRYNYLEMYLV